LLRRVLPVAAAAAVVLVPSSAWAAPASGPVSHFAYAGYFAQVDAQLPDGRTVHATLSRYYGANHSVSDGFLDLTVGPPCDVASTGQQCLPGASGFAQLTGDQVEFDRGLTGASVEDGPLTLTTPGHYVWNSGVPGAPSDGGDPPPLGPPPFPPAESSGPVYVPETTEDVTVSLDFTGTGTISRSAQHILADYCGADSMGCQATGIGARRTADVTVTLAWASGETSALDSDAGLLTYDQAVDNATPAGAH
jgi:hypothetical protein